MTARSIWITVSTISAAACVLIACNHENRYRALTFFFDGVPEEWAPDYIPPPAEEITLPGDDELTDLSTSEPRTGSRLRIGKHPPYKQSRCAACHSSQPAVAGGKPTDDVCRQCHEGLTSNLRFVHGPVAVEACLFCHHPHGSKHPYLMRQEPEALCLRCHDREAVISGEHHAQSNDRTCIECHSGHGGDARYFLKAANR